MTPSLQKLRTYFDFKRVTPSSLEQDNLILFKYISRDSIIHDKTPLVFVLEKRLDRVYGINLHYDGVAIQTLIDNVSESVNEVLLQEWAKKYPEELESLENDGGSFNKKMLKENDLRQFKKKVPRRMVETYDIENHKDDSSALRTYLYVKMNDVNKLVWKI